MRLETETAVALDGISEKAASPFLLQDVIRIPADVLEELTPEQICLAPTIATRPKHVQVQTLVKQLNGKGAKVAQLLLYFQYFRHQRIYLQASHILWTLWISWILFRSVLICCWRFSEQSSSPVIRCCSMLHTLVLRDPRCFLLYKECTCETLWLSVDVDCFWTFERIFVTGAGADIRKARSKITDDHPYNGEPTQLKLAGQTQTWKTLTTYLRKLACRDSGLLVLLSWPCLNQDALEKINMVLLQAKMAGRAFANWGCSFASCWNWSLCVCCLCPELPSTWWRASMAPRVLGRHPVEIPNGLHTLYFDQASNSMSAHHDSEHSWT